MRPIASVRPSSRRPSGRAALARLALAAAATGVAAGVAASAEPASAGARPLLELGSWYRAPVCEGTICTRTSGDDLPLVLVRGYGFSAQGEVLVGFYRPQAADPDRLYETFTDSSGSFKVPTPLPDCSALPSPRAAAYEVQALDLASGLWSDIADAVLCVPVAP